MQDEQGKVVPNAVVTAFRHVQGIFPQVTKVTYQTDARWMFASADGEAPDFGGAVDVGLLEDAADAVESVPVTFTLKDIEFAESQRKLPESQSSQDRFHIKYR